MLHVAILVLTTATASADDAGRAGRSVACADSEVFVRTGPYAGSFYSYPLLAVLAVVAIVAVVASRAVMRRPRGLAPSEYGDDALRARSLPVIVSAVGPAVGATHTGAALVAGSGLGQSASSDCPWMAPVGGLLTGTVPLALLVACFCGVRLLVTDRLPVAERVAAR